MPVYFAHRRSLWERGSSEHLNNIVRSTSRRSEPFAFGPKTSGNGGLRSACDINDRPRTIRNWNKLSGGFSPTRRARCFRWLKLAATWLKRAT
jgi:IS30 family transposase